MKKVILRISSCVLLLCTLLSFSVSGKTDESYYYDNAGEAHEAPAAYTFENAVYFGRADLPEIGTVSDMHTDSEGNIYLLSSADGHITVLNSSMNFVKTIIPSENGESVDTKGSMGMFIAEYKDKFEIYVADTNNGRVLRLNSDGEVERIFSRPDTELIDSETRFLPTKIAVNESGYLIVICQGIYSGAVVMNGDGEFLGFYGSNKIKLTASVLYEYFWKQLFGDSKSDTMLRYVPVEFSNLAINENGFIYTTTVAETDNSGIRLLNFSGVNILPEKDMGDLEIATAQGDDLASAFSDIAYLGDGVICALDASRSRIFVNNGDGDLLTVFGGNGSYNGKFSNPTAIESFGDNIYVYDEAARSLNLFTPTGYGKELLGASEMYRRGNYDEAMEIWESVLRQNNGFQTAYISIGRSLMSMNDYKGAMKYFKLGESKSDYSEAFSEQRKIILKQWFLPIFIFIILLVIAVFYLMSDKRSAKRVKKENRGEGMAYALFHPTKGMLGEVNRTGGVQAFIFPIVLASWFVISIFSYQYSGFIFSKVDTNPLDLRVEFIGTVVAAVGFVSANWLIVTMTEGIGTLRQISRVVAISLIPYLCGKLLSTLLSNLLLIDEAAMVNAPVVLTMIWSFFLLVTGLAKIHDFKLSQAVLNLVFTVFGMVAIAFLLLLEISILKQIQMLFVTIFDELVMLMQ